MERVRAFRFHANPIAAPRHISTELQVVACSDPRTAYRYRYGFRFSKDAITVYFTGNHFCEVSGIECAGHVVDYDQRWRLDENTGQLFAPFFRIDWRRY